MFTLPVTSWALTASKAIAAICMVVMSILAISVSMLFFVIGSDGWSNFYNNIEMNPVGGIIFILVCIIMIFQQICLIYAVISASHILPRFRFAAGAVIYFTVMYLLEQPVFHFLGSFSEHAGSFYYDSSLVYLIPYGIAGLVFGMIFFWATGFLLKYRLNLE